MLDNRRHSPAADTIQALAEQHKVAYRQTAADLLGNEITRLSGDDVVLDDVELLLLALERSGHIDSIEATRLHAAYLHDVKP